MMRVGLIGVGTMGAHMARHLLDRGHELAVNDVRPEGCAALVELGAVLAATPAELAARSEVVLTSLPGPTQVEEVALGADGVLAGATSGTVHLDLSTNAWSTVMRTHAAYEGSGVEFLDAPVSGGPKGAASGKLAVWVGGDEDAFMRARPVLDDLADRVAHVGAIGAGTVVKLAHNATGNSLNLVLAELFSVADAAGVDPLTVWRYVRQGAIGRRRTFDSLAEHFLIDDYDPPAMTLSLARKDMALLVDLAESVGFEAPVARSTLDRMDEAASRGWDLRDSRVPMLLARERLGERASPAATREQVAAVLAEDPPSPQDVRH